MSPALQLSGWQPDSSICENLNAAVDDTLLWTVTGADGLSIQSKRGKIENQASETNSKTNKPLNDWSITGLWIRFLSSKMHKKKMGLLKFIYMAVWELYLEKEPCVVGKCFILFQIDGENIAIQAI